MLHPSRKNRLGDLSINIVIIAVLALFVLVILLVIFGRGISPVTQATTQCTAKGGLCDATSACSSAELKTICGDFGCAVYPGTDCDKKTPKEVCCVPLARQ